MSQGRYFFLTKEDLISIVQSVQTSEPVFYVETDELIIRERQIPDGSMRYLVDQMENKDWQVLYQ